MSSCNTGFLWVENQAIYNNKKKLYLNTHILLKLWSPYQASQSIHCSSLHNYCFLPTPLLLFVIRPHCTTWPSLIIKTASCTSMNLYIAPAVNLLQSGSFLKTLLVSSCLSVWALLHSQAAIKFYALFFSFPVHFASKALESFAIQYNLSSFFILKEIKSFYSCLWALSSRSYKTFVIDTKFF